MSRIASRSAAVALTSAALMGLSALAIPGVAAAEDVNCDPDATTYSVTGGSIEWGFKQSFRSYFQTGAQGTWTLSEGVSFKGSGREADGRFAWPISEGAVSGANNATASGDGSVHFVGHSGALDTTLSNPTVEITGTSGVLKLDYAGNEFTMNPNDPAVPISGTQVVAATFTLPNASVFQTGGQVTVSSNPSVIGDAFVPAFDSYPSGTQLDPVTVVLDITAPCNGEVGGDDDNGGIFGSLGNLFDFGS